MHCTQSDEEGEVLYEYSSDINPDSSTPNLSTYLWHRRTNVHKYTNNFKIVIKYLFLHYVSPFEGTSVVFFSPWKMFISFSSTFARFNVNNNNIDISSKTFYEIEFFALVNVVEKLIINVPILNMKWD